MYIIDTDDMEYFKYLIRLDVAQNPNDPTKKMILEYIEKIELLPCPKSPEAYEAIIAMIKVLG